MVGEGKQYFICPNIGGLHGDFQCQKIPKSPEKTLNKKTKNSYTPEI